MAIKRRWQQIQGNDQDWIKLEKQTRQSKSEIKLNRRQKKNEGEYNNETKKK